MKAIISLVLLVLGSVPIDQPVAKIDDRHSSEASACLNELPGAFDFSKPIVVGEFHGTEQSAPLILSLICEAMERGRSVTLAVEMPPEAAADVYGPPVENSFWGSPYPDGRASIAMRSLLESLSDLRRSGAVEVIGFKRDDQSQPSSEADDAMRIMRDRRFNDALLVLVGNYHARRKLDPTEDETLTSALGDVVNVNVAGSLPGEAWVCMPECGVHAIGGSTGRLPLGFSAVAPANGFDFYYVVDRYTPSQPYRR